MAADWVAMSAMSGTAPWCAQPRLRRNGGCGDHAGMVPARDGEDERGDAALLALERLLSALDEVEGDIALIRARAAVIKAERGRGVGYRDLVPAEDRPLVVQLLSQLQERVAAAGSEWRREEAR